MDKITSTRTCGECTMCCTTHAVMDDDGELFKSPFTKCKYQVDGKGCVIHKLIGRPETCRGYLCGCRKDIGREEDRPDKVGVVLDRRETILGVAPVLFVTDAARDSEYVRETTLHYALALIPIFHVYADGTQKVFFKEGVSLDAISMLKIASRHFDIVFLTPP
jgi:hypothetical protein